MLDLAAVFLAGLLGSAHCVGMCGGFVVLLGLDADRRTTAFRQAAYFSGKTMTYAAFGAVAGAAGGLVQEALAGFGGVLSVGLGVALVAVGLGLCGLGGSLAPRVGGRWVARLGPAIRRLVASGRPGPLVALGALNGLLPCGLVYGMLTVAAGSGSASQGALTMAVFGLATVPALALAGGLGGLLRPSRRLWMQRAAGALVVVVGLLTVVRGAGALMGSGHATHGGAVPSGAVHAGHAAP